MCHRLHHRATAEKKSELALLFSLESISGRTPNAVEGIWGHRSQQLWCFLYPKPGTGSCLPPTAEDASALMCDFKPAPWNHKGSLHGRQTLSRTLCSWPGDWIRAAEQPGAAVLGTYPIDCAEVHSFSKIEPLIEATVVSPGEGDDKLSSTLVGSIHLGEETEKH